MSEHSLSASDTEQPSMDDQPKSTLHVCVSCRPPGAPREPQEKRAGYILYRLLRDALGTSPLKHQVDIKPAECLSVCPRPCGIALSRAGTWTYLFGDQEPEQNVQDILDCVALYCESSDGYLSRDDRPKALRAAILGRIPPVRGS